MCGSGSNDLLQDSIKGIPAICLLFHSHSSREPKQGSYIMANHIFLYSLLTTLIPEALNNMYMCIYIYIRRTLGL